MTDTKFSKQELQVDEWTRKARDDERSIRAIIDDESGAPNTACFLAQQMAEKYLKAFLVLKRQWFPKIHELGTLWELVQEHDNTFEKIQNDCLFLSDFYVETRYPGDYPEFSWKDAKKAFATAQRIKDFVIERIHSADTTNR